MYNKFQGKSWSVNYCVQNEHNFPFFFLFANIFFKTTHIACKVFFRGRRFSKNLEFRILADFKILAFKNRDFKILDDINFLAFQNPEFKILAHLLQLSVI